MARGRLGEPGDPVQRDVDEAIGRELVPAPTLRLDTEERIVRETMCTAQIVTAIRRIVHSRRRRRTRPSGVRGAAGPSAAKTANSTDSDGAEDPHPIRVPRLHCSTQATILQLDTRNISPVQALITLL